LGGFLDAKERVIDMILTETGKQLLMKGELRFVYWTPFDDEVDYNPQVQTLDLGHTQQTIQERKNELIETPLVTEAKMGYRGLNLVSEDLTNVHRPMFTAVPGVGVSTPLPQASVDKDAIVINIEQKKLTKTYVQLDSQGRAVGGRAGPITVGYQRSNGSTADIYATYSTGTFTQDSQLEGFLLTMYQSSSLASSSIGTGVLADTYVIDIVNGSVGGHQEVIHNRDSKGNIVYHNNLTLAVKTP
jgi:hypothetical protein